VAAAMPEHAMICSRADESDARLWISPGSRVGRKPGYFSVVDNTSRHLGFNVPRMGAYRDAFRDTS